MKIVGIVGGGPQKELPNLQDYNTNEMIWIGADRGSIALLEQNIVPNFAIGDFDSMDESELIYLNSKVNQVHTYKSEKDETDIELALLKAINLGADKVYMFGVTGGRLDHEMASIQMLYKLEKESISGAVINNGNWIELKLPGVHTIEYDPIYKYISFIPQSFLVSNLTLNGFYYPLSNRDIEFGSSICISNQLIGKKGTFSFHEGILLLIKSHDVPQ